MPSLLAEKSNIYSQNGEDGVIAAIFESIGAETEWCCEFGAWDRLHFSNTRRVVEVNAGHDPAAPHELLAAEVAQENVGQPFAAFHASAKRRGYELVGYTGNGFGNRFLDRRSLGLSVATAARLRLGRLPSAVGCRRSASK